MELADKINEILDKKSRVDDKKAISQIELFMNWLFSNYEFRINSLSLKAEFRELGSREEFRELDDAQFNTISILAEINGFSKSMVEKLNRILISHYVPQVNELKDFFSKVEVLGRAARIDNDYFYMPTVRDYFDCLVLSDESKKELLYMIFSRWVVACVNSALGIKHNDVMLILSGSQGIYKTSFLNNLVPRQLRDKYLVSGHIEPSLTNQNTANFLCEKFIVNIDDQLEVIFGKEYNSMKAIISADRVTSRRVYAKFDRTRKRIANFVGSVNGNEFLTDNQNRRYFVIEISKIDPAYKNIDMDRFWAEAYQISLKTEPYQIYTRDIYHMINEISQSFVHSSIEQSLIMRFFSPEKTDDKNVKLFMSSGEIQLELQRFTGKQLSNVKIGIELRRLGYIRTIKYNNDKKYSRYCYILFTTMDHAYSYFRDYLEKDEKVF